MNEDLKRIEEKLDRVIAYIEQPRVRLVDYSQEWDALGRSIKATECYKRGKAMTKEQKAFWRGE